MNSKQILVLLSCLVEVAMGLQFDMNGSKTVANIDDDEASFVLNCTYSEDAGNIVNPGRPILWRKPDPDINVAGFSKPGGDGPIYYTDGDYLKNRSRLIGPTENSKSAVIAIDDVLCEDDRHSFYCRISFESFGGPQTEDSDTVTLTLRKAAKQPLDYPLISTTQTQECNEIRLACTADVGKPPGYVTWWRFRADDSIFMIGQSELIEDEAGNCEFFASVNITYEVSKEDNGAFFRCTSDNNITEGPGPEDSNLYRDTDKINVLYEASVIEILRVPEMNIYPISTPELSLTCRADGNPLPSHHDYTWSFQGFDSNTTEDTISHSNSLVLYNLQESHSGIYTCTVTNPLNSTHSSNITVVVNGTIPDPPLLLHCHSSPCSVMERCIDLGRGFKCETNGMAAAGVAFIVLTIASIAVSLGVMYYARKISMHVKVDAAHQGAKCNGQSTTVPKPEVGETDASTSPGGSNVVYATVEKANGKSTTVPKPEVGQTDACTSPGGSNVVYATVEKA